MEVQVLSAAPFFMKQCAIYIPGIRDDIGRLQSLLIQTWRFRGIRPHMHVFPWRGEDDFELKLQHLLTDIDEHAQRGYQVSLVAASAGATAALQAYVLRKDKLAKVVFICGKINRPHPAGSRVYRQNPAYQAALEKVPKAIARLSADDKPKLLTMYSEVDGIVPNADSLIPGVKSYILPPRPHALAIFHTISLGARPLIDFIKNKAV